MSLMQLDAATKLAASLVVSGPSLTLCATVEKDRIVFSGGRDGSHSLAISASSEARVRAHWSGYVENNGLALAGGSR